MDPHVFRGPLLSVCCHTQRIRNVVYGTDSVVSVRIYSLPTPFVVSVAH